MTKMKFSKRLRKPNFFMPDGACDSHHHIFDRAFPYAPDDKRDLPQADLDDYLSFKETMGLKRHVLVQPSSYGTDNRCLLDALKRAGPDARGEAVINEYFTDQQLAELSSGGVVGIRFNFGAGKRPDPQSIIWLADRVYELGWHVQFHARTSDLINIHGVVEKIRNPIVLDHFARLPVASDLDHPAFKLVKKILETENGWVKLSAPYHLSSLAGYDDLRHLVDFMTSCAPKRLLWGSDWPHPSEITAHKAIPDDVSFIEKLRTWVGSDERFLDILVKNPDELFFKAH